ncbi:hypothetical protein [Pandoraea communis]|uniref:hypothetical protein n=1 Tax=Pandoraea communis TaxID=2508297 RepID=UPI00124060BB|nr:hypothetical protein [Pandoraea communis]
MSPTSLSSPDPAFARHALSITGRSPAQSLGTRLPRGIWWVAIAVLALHWLVWIATPVSLADLGGKSSERTAMQVTIITPPAPRRSALQPPFPTESPRENRTTPAARIPAPAPEPRPTSPSANPTEPRVSPPAVLSAPTLTPALDWRADVAREAGTRAASKASSPVASAERAITEQSQRAAPHDTPPAQGSVAQRAFEREFGPGQSAVSGPKATREGGNPVGTRECIEMNGKKTCSRRRNLANDIDPFMKRERLFAPEIGSR